MTPDLQPTAATERAFWDAAAQAPDGGRLAIWGEPGRWEERIPECFEACVRPVLDALTPLASTAGAEVHIADLGCGIGRLTLPAAILMPEATFYAVDISARMLTGLWAEVNRVATPQKPIDNVQPVLCDGRTLPNACATLDGCFSMVTLQHMPWAAAWGYLRAVARALVPGGVFRFQFVEGDQAEERSHHFPLERVTEAIEKAGLKVTAVDRGLLYDAWVFVTARKPI